jgi:hypothetical protein
LAFLAIPLSHSSILIGRHRIESLIRQFPSGFRQKYGFQKGPTPTTTGPGAETLTQLGRPLWAFNADEIHQFLPADVKTQTDLVFVLHPNGCRLHLCCDWDTTIIGS